MQNNAKRARFRPDVTRMVALVRRIDNVIDNVFAACRMLEEGQIEECRLRNED